MQVNEVLSKAAKQTEAWGYTLSVDCRGCKKSIVCDKEKLRKFILDLVKEIDMVAHGPMLIEHFPNRDAGREGYSLVQLIETSSITGHFVDKTGDAYIDIFSCKNFSPEDALKFINKHLHPKNVKFVFETREA